MLTKIYLKFSLTSKKMKNPVKNGARLCNLGSLVQSICPLGNHSITRRKYPSKEQSQNHTLLNSQYNFIQQISKSTCTGNVCATISQYWNHVWKFPVYVFENVNQVCLIIIHNYLLYHYKRMQKNIRNLLCKDVRVPMLCRGTFHRVFITTHCT